MALTGFIETLYLYGILIDPEPMEPSFQVCPSHLRYRTRLSPGAYTSKRLGAGVIATANSSTGSRSNTRGRLRALLLNE